MLTHYCKDPMVYNGKQLSSLWAYKNFGLRGDSIVSFRGPCRVEFTEMVDLEDVLAKSPIYGPDMLHFIAEHFDSDLEKMVLRQRLFIAIVKDVLGKYTRELTRSGDDLYLGGKKLSISIATATPVSVMMHTALNIDSRGTPVPTVGLLELGAAEKEISGLAGEICEAYAAEVKGIYMARCKVRGVT
ncbi:MAG: hypothetical protein VR69_16470 [Peptococcaceae bacterium BRH_c4b]|nr:MAG: hypothetical protein VR69_16470 [Peptococcaceae bacterium BRH_c4b]